MTTHCKECSRVTFHFAVHTTHSVKCRVPLAKRQLCNAHYDILFEVKRNVFVTIERERDGKKAGMKQQQQQ